MTVRLSKPLCEKKAVFSYPEASRLLRVPLECPAPELSLLSFSIDTRTLQENELFVALTGQNTDGHEHVVSAYERGASGVLIEIRKKEKVAKALQQAGCKARNILAVEDPQKAIAELAAHYRSPLETHAIGVVGSVGKTTTKECLYFLLRQKFSAIATVGNLNNHLGVPIMLSRLKPEHRFAVMELGASHVGEIAYLSKLIKPDGAILTPIGPAHLEGFGSLANVYLAKAEIVDFLEPTAPLVIPDEDSELQRVLLKKGRKKFITVGLSSKADYQISNVLVERDIVTFLLNGKWKFSFPGQAAFLATNAALAIAMAAQWGFSIEEMPKEWKDVGFASGRFRETILANGIRVIDDSYNASPLAFSEGISAFEAIPCNGKKFLVFADMLELGADEIHFHQELGKKIAKAHVDYALAYGQLSSAAIGAVLKASKRFCEARHFADSLELMEFLRAVVRPGDLVFLKGSRSMRVETVLTRIKELVFSVS